MSRKDYSKFSVLHMDMDKEMKLTLKATAAKKDMKLRELIITYCKEGLKREE